MKRLLLLLFFLFPLITTATTVSPTEATTLSDISISGYSNNRIYLYVEGVDNTATAWQPTGHATYLCGSNYASSEGDPKDPSTIMDVWDGQHSAPAGPNGPVGASCPALDTAGIYWVLTTDTGSYMEWDQIEITEASPPAPEGYSTSSEPFYTAVAGGIDNLTGIGYYGFIGVATSTLNSLLGLFLGFLDEFWNYLIGYLVISFALWAIVKFIMVLKFKSKL